MPASSSEPVKNSCVVSWAPISRSCEFEIEPMFGRLGERLAVDHELDRGRGLDALDGVPRFIDGSAGLPGTRLPAFPELRIAGRTRRP